MGNIGGVQSSYKELLKAMRKKPIICTSITTDDKRSYISSLRRARNRGSDLGELRIDCFDRINTREINSLIQKSVLPVIVTNRNKENGGFFSKGEKARLLILKNALEARPMFIDIELATNAEDRSTIINSARKNGVGIICSYHDFHQTPDINEILDIYDKICNTKADIAKLVFKTKSNKDVRTILKAARKLYSKKTPFTIFGMGPKGKITRLISPLLGSSLTYSALNNNPENELGQYSLDETRKFFDMMGKKGWNKLRKRSDDLIHIAMIEFNDDHSYPLTSIETLIN